MLSVLLFVLLLTIFFDPVAATGPSMEFDFPMASLESFYPDPENILADFCAVCYHYRDQCLCMITPQMFPQFTTTWSSTITAETLLNHDDWPRDAAPPAPASPQTQPLYDNTPGQPLINEVVEHLREAGTRVLPSTIKVHIDTTYLPGDRTQPAAKAPRKSSNTRHKLKRDGFPCPKQDCDKVYHRDCDLKRHCKTHVPRNERPHKCKVCGQGFQYPKDLKRHRPTHASPESSPETLFHCPDCNTGFPRRDNMLRHQRKQHPSSDSS
ncbi:hypothetical protein BCR34DRAFT_607029 [Clohesyomyces aquaticus]|uniref:C2H2-type domain-containing protein n=1 Tax=Clohesyomyces aquaticus TaxID=1231657 RepID=A0A1Y1YJ99_9PLEO|nr:hypothetical protein BCR34DRAFT_607029 [Clohesyomyces aquaticus]